MRGEPGGWWEALWVRGAVCGPPTLGPRAKEKTKTQNSKPSPLHFPQSRHVNSPPYPRILNCRTSLFYTPLPSVI